MKTLIFIEWKLIVKYRILLHECVLQVLIGSFWSLSLHQEEFGWYKMRMLLHQIVRVQKFQVFHIYVQESHYNILGVSLYFSEIFRKYSFATSILSFI